MYYGDDDRPEEPRETFEQAFVRVMENQAALTRAEEKEQEMNTTESFAGLKKTLKKTRVRKVADGTVVKFVSGGRYTYAAIYVAGRWYLTGNGYWFGKNVFENDEFINDVLAKASDGTVKGAIEWEDIA